MCVGLQDRFFFYKFFFIFLSNQVTVHCNSEMVKNGMRIFMPFRCSNIRCQDVAYFDISARGKNGICLFLSTERQWRFSVVMLVPWYQRWTNVLIFIKACFPYLFTKGKIIAYKMYMFLLIHTTALCLCLTTLSVSWVKNDVSTSMPHKPIPFRYLSMGVWVTNNQVQISMYVNKISFI